MEEIWKDVIGYEGLYKVSNLGRIISVERYQKNHSKMQLVKEHFMTQSLDGLHRYNQVTLSKDGNAIKHLVHRLVAEAFIENKENKLEVNHIDGNKLNNRVDNLEWCTRSENMKHAHKMGLANNSVLASKRNIFKAIEANSKKVCVYSGDYLVGEYLSTHDAERNLSLYRGQICRILRGKCKNTTKYIFEYK